MAEFVLGAWSIVLAMASYILFGLAFRRLGAPRSAALQGVAALSILPFGLESEVTHSRVWEGSLGVALGSLALYLIAVRKDAFAAVASAITFFVMPPLGLGALAAMACQALWHRSWRSIAFMALALTVVLVRWTFRNSMEMGSPIFLRSNLGLEMAVAFHGEERELKRHYRTIHPAWPEGFRRMQEAGGEVTYSRLLLDQNVAWIEAHPARAAAIVASNLREFILPPASSWDSDQGRLRLWQLRMALCWGIGIAGLLGAALAIWRRERLLLAAIMLGVAIAPYGLVFPVLRYRYSVTALLALYSAYLLVEVYRAYRARSGSQC